MTCFAWGASKGPRGRTGPRVRLCSGEPAREGDAGVWRAVTCPLCIQRAGRAGPVLPYRRRRAARAVRVRRPERLLERLRRDLPQLQLSATAVLVRVYPAASSRVSGAWTWCVLESPSGGEHSPPIGSQHPMLECLEAASLTADQDNYRTWHVSPT